jgi:hypothetical protein
MSSLFRKLRAGIRDHGAGYVGAALGNELRNPRRPWTMALRRALIAVRAPFHRPRRDQGTWSRDCLQFVFDLSAAPITFDFASYLVAAELERRRRKLAGLTVLIVPAADGGLRREQGSLALFDEEARRFRLRHILLPILALLPSVRGYAVCASREQAADILTNDEARLYPSDYRLYQPRQPHKRVVHDLHRAGEQMWPMFQATPRAREFVAQFLAARAGGRRPIVITLRSSPHSPQRNSHVEDWLRFAGELDPSLYLPIFVLDTEAAMAPRAPGLADHLICEAASWDVEVRMALSEAAWLNMAQMHGPMELCWYNENARYVVFLEVGTAPENMPAYLSENGHDLGVDFTFAATGQHIVWKPDLYKNIVEAFASLAPKLGASDPRMKS